MYYLMRNLTSIIRLFHADRQTKRQAGRQRNRQRYLEHTEEIVTTL